VKVFGSKSTWQVTVGELPGPYAYLHVYQALPPSEGSPWNFCIATAGAEESDGMVRKSFSEIYKPKDWIVYLFQKPGAPVSYSACLLMVPAEWSNNFVEAVECAQETRATSLAFGTSWQDVVNPYLPVRPQTPPNVQSRHYEPGQLPQRWNGSQATTRVPSSGGGSDTVRPERRRQGGSRARFQRVWNEFQTEWDLKQLSRTRQYYMPRS